MKVVNMENANGHRVPNQFVIYNDDGSVLFQSYSSVIVKIDRKNDKTYLDKNYWDYSRTTGKYRNLFLHELKAETEKKIKSGEYELVDLN
jgi:hypothetical protein